VPGASSGKAAEVLLIAEADEGLIALEVRYGGIVLL